MSYSIKDLPNPYNTYKSLDIDVWMNVFNKEEINEEFVIEYLDFLVDSILSFDKERYCEKHHAIPKCIDDLKMFTKETVKINGANHFQAHLKLLKCFNGKKKGTLTYALMLMKNNVLSNGEVISPENWEQAKAEYSKANSERMKLRTGPLNSMYGKHPTPNLSTEERERRRQRVLGDKNPSKRKDVREKMSKAMLGKFDGENNPFYGKKHSKESRELQSQAKLGENNPCYKKIWITNGETDKRVSIEELEFYKSIGFNRGRRVSKETRTKMSISQSSRERDSKGRFI